MRLRFTTGRRAGRLRLQSPPEQTAQVQTRPPRLGGLGQVPPTRQAWALLMRPLGMHQACRVQGTSRPRDRAPPCPALAGVTASPRGGTSGGPSPVPHCEDNCFTCDLSLQIGNHSKSINKRITFSYFFIILMFYQEVKKEKHTHTTKLIYHEFSRITGKSRDGKAVQTKIAVGMRGELRGCGRPCPSARGWRC